MSDYSAKYEKQFVRNLQRYASLRSRIKRCVERIIAAPYTQTEFPGDITGKLNLKGCRSARVDRNFRVIFCYTYKELSKKYLKYDLTYIL